MQDMVKRLLKRKGNNLPSRQEMISSGIQKVDIKAAAEHVEGKLPEDVASLVHVVNIEGKSKSQQPFAEESLAKARKYLNEMVEKAWHELDDKLIECKEFEDKNRGTFEQVMTDIARLAEQIADLERLKSEATEMINMKEQEISGVQEQLKKETDIYMKIYLENKMEMTIRKNDLAVFQFMMQLVKCKSAAFAQVDQTREARICESKEGLVLNFGDKKTMAEVERRMTPAARRAVNEVLQHVESQQAQDAAGLLQGEAAKARGNDDELDDDVATQEDGSKAQEQAALSSLGVEAKQDATTTTATTTPSLPTPAVPKVKVQKE